jgi:hypothetical protein
MAESFVQLNNDGPGKKIDTFTEATNGQHRQAMVVSDPSVTGGTAQVDPALGLSVNPKALPPNAAVEAGGHLASLDSKEPPLGQAVMAASTPVAIASNQTPIEVELFDSNEVPITSTGGALDVNLKSSGVTQPVSGTVTTVPPANASTNVTQIGGSAISEGQKAMAASVPVVVASDQSAVPISGTVTTTPPSNASTNITQVGGSAISEGQKAMAASVPVVIASDQTAVPVSGTVTTTPPSNASTNITQVGGSALSEGQKAMAASVPVVIASDQSAVPVSGSVSVSNFPATQPVSGTVTANQGTAAADTAAWPIKSGVVAQVTATWNSSTPNNTVLSISTTDMATVLWTHNPTGSITGSPFVYFEASYDGGTTWLVKYTTIAGYGQDQFNYPLASAAVYSHINVAGFTNFRIRVTPAPTGTGSMVETLQAFAFGVRVDDAPAQSTPVTGTVTANQGTANATPWNENSAQIAGTATATAAAGVQKVGISGATAAALDAVVTAATAPANGVAVLAVNNTTPPSLTTGQSVALQCDYEGSLFVKNYRRAQTVTKATTIASSATATTVLAAQAAGIFADISMLIITTTAAATTPIQFTATLSDGTNSFIYDLDTGATATPSPQGNLVFNFTPPIPATTAATAWTIQLSVATVTVHITVVAVLQKAS